MNTDFIEVRILSAVKELLAGRVNEILSNYDVLTPVIEFGKYLKNVNPSIALNACETTEKERIVRVDAYALTITFSVPETEDSEIFCYGYNHAFCKALSENTTLGGIVERAIVTERKYTPPKVKGCGNDWEVVLKLRITVVNEQ